MDILGFSKIYDKWLPYLTAIQRQFTHHSTTIQLLFNDNSTAIQRLLNDNSTAANTTVVLCCPFL